VPSPIWVTAKPLILAKAMIIQMISQAYVVKSKGSVHWVDTVTGTQWYDPDSRNDSMIQCFNAYDD